MKSKTTTLIALFFALFCASSWGQEPPTFAKDIAPILYQNCVTCHRPDGGAPFNFMTEVDPMRRHKLIAYVTEEKQMPPWKVSDSDYEFANERSLTPEEIKTLEDWSAAGAPLGDMSQLPEAPTFAAEWHIGKPDLIVREEEPYTVPAEGPDIYRNTVIRLPPTPEGKYIRAIEYLPSAKGSSHHCLIYVDPTGHVREYLEARPGENQNLPIVLNRDRIEAWAVGQVMFGWPEGIRRRFPEGVDLVLQTHFHPIGKEEVSQNSLGIFYDEHPPTRHYINFDVPFGFGITHNMLIPPGESHYTVYDEFEVQGDALLHIIYPHAHSVCSGMESVAHFPDGTQKLLIRIHNWDFAWQERYIFKEELHIPKGTVFKNQFWYDNSADNPNNPFDPPQVIINGPDSTNEMCAFTYAFMSEEEKELDAIAAGFGKKTIADIKKADFTIPIPAIMQTEIIPKFDKNKDGKISAGETVAYIAREALISIKSGVGPMDAITDEFGIQRAFERKIALTIAQLAFKNYWYFILAGLAVFAVVLFGIFKLTKKAYRRIRKYSAVPHSG